MASSRRRIALALLVSIAQAFGVAIDSFGTQPNAADAKGPLAGLR